MGVKQLFKNIRHLSERDIAPDFVPRTVAGPADFFTWTGSECSPAFHIDFSNCGGLNTAYSRCATLKTVINRNAMSMANGKWWITDEQDNDVKEHYANINALICNPNPLQTTTEFVMQLDVMRQLKGEVFVYAAAPEGMGADSASALWVVNPDYIDIKLSRKLYMQSDIKDIVLEYYLNIDGKRQPVDAGHLLHIKDVNQNISFSPTDIRGKSRLSGLEYSIKNIIQAEEAIYALNKDRGAMGVLSNETNDSAGHIPVTEEEKQSLHSHYSSAYGLSSWARKVIITDASLKWQPMSFSVKDLMLIEGMDKNIQLIASTMGYPYELLGVISGHTFNSNSGSFNNEAKKLLYQDNVIPIANIYGEKLSEFFGLDKDKIIIDFSHVECLNTAEAEAANTLLKKVSGLKQLYVDRVITLEEYRLALGYDEDFYGDTFYQSDSDENKAINQRGSQEN